MTTMPPGNYPPAGLRASDADRDLVVAELSQSFEAGRLTSEEFDERTSQALAARTMGQLAALTADLPAGQPPAQAPARPQPGGRRRAMRAPVVAALAAIIIIAALLGSVTAHSGRHLWWIVPVVLIVARRAARRGQRGPL
jgi:hypothetical protein